MAHSKAKSSIWAVVATKTIVDHRCSVTVVNALLMVSVSSALDRQMARNSVIKAHAAHSISSSPLADLVRNTWAAQRMALSLATKDHVVRNISSRPHAVLVHSIWAAQRMANTQKTFKHLMVTRHVDLHNSLTGRLNNVVRILRAVHIQIIATITSMAISHNVIISVAKVHKSPCMKTRNHTAAHKAPDHQSI
jgi:hypothetical protein